MAAVAEAPCDFASRLVHCQQLVPESAGSVAIVETLRASCLTAGKRNDLTLKHASDAVRGDREIVRVAVSLYWRELQYAAEALKGDRELIMMAVGANGMALEFASGALRGDREVVELAVSRHGLALQFASEELRGDLDIVEAAVSSAAGSLAFASDRLLEDAASLQTLVAKIEPPHAVFKVSMVSGRSCIFALNVHGPYVQDDFVKSCAQGLALTSAQVAGAMLMAGQNLVSAGASFGGSFGQLNELRIVLSNHSSVAN